MMAIRNSLCRLILVPAFAAIGFGCSYQTPILLINVHNSPRTVYIHFSRPDEGTPLFVPGRFVLHPLEAGDTVDFSRPQPMPSNQANTVTIELPARSALSLAVLRNETYRTATQEFINQRRFNIEEIAVGNERVNRGNFDAQFRRTPDGIAWSIP